MHEVIDPRVYEILRPVYVGLYWEWALLWCLVAWYYGRSAYASWRAGGGSPGRILCDLTQPLWWGLQHLLARAGLRRNANVLAAQTVPSTYGGGHLLRWAIFVGSLTPVMFGFMFADVQRSHWTNTQLWLTLAAVSLSCLAALSHLLLAYRTQPLRWGAVVAAALAWPLVVPPLLRLVGWA